MKSLLFTFITLTTLAAGAIQEVAYDAKDTTPADHMLVGLETRTKQFAHSNGQTYAVMYVAQNNAGQVSTQIIGLCNIGYKDSVERCTQDKDPVLQEVYKAVIQANKPDCSKVALLNQDHNTTLKRIQEYNSTNHMRDLESNARALLPIAASLTFQVETLNTLVPSANMAESVSQTKKLMDDVSNKRMTPYEAMARLSSRTSAIKRDFATLLSASRCTQEDMQMCRFNKTTGELLTPEVNIDQYNKYIEVERKGLVEMRACSTATATVAPAAPVIQQPAVQEPAVVNTPAVKAPDVNVVEPQAVDPTSTAQ